MDRTKILQVAHQAVTIDRAATHGDAEANFSTIAAVWGAKLGVDITPEQVAIMMIDLKMVRAWRNPGHADNWIDMAGYAACGGEIATPEKIATAEEIQTPEPQERKSTCRSLKPVWS